MTSAIAAPLALIFATNASLLARALDGVSDQHYRQRSGERSNSPAWVAGHAVQTRASLLALLGDPFDTGWGHTFDRGAEPGDPASYPDRDSLVTTAQQIAARLQTALAALDQAALAEPARGPKLPNVTTIADMLAFFALHDSYHVGQLGYLRKALGYPSLVG